MARKYNRQDFWKKKGNSQKCGKGWISSGEKCNANNSGGFKEKLKKVGRVAKKVAAGTAAVGAVGVTAHGVYRSIKSYQEAQAAGERGRGRRRRSSSKPARPWHQVLDVPKNASPEEIKAAYRKKALELHPDKNRDDPRAEEKFKELGNAYDEVKGKVEKERKKKKRSDSVLTDIDYAYIQAWQQHPYVGKWFWLNDSPNEIEASAMGDYLWRV